MPEPLVLRVDEVEPLDEVWMRTHGWRRVAHVEHDDAAGLVRLRFDRGPPLERLRGAPLKVRRNR